MYKGSEGGKKRRKVGTVEGEAGKRTRKRKDTEGGRREAEMETRQGTGRDN